jgi:hypothetical protein
VNGRKRLKVNHLEKYDQKDILKDESIEVLKISFEPRAMVIEGQEPRVFSFLGLKGNFDIYIDKNSRVPVQISGKLPIVGNIDIPLREVRLNKDERRKTIDD